MAELQSSHNALQAANEELQGQVQAQGQTDAQPGPAGGSSSPNGTDTSQDAPPAEPDVLITPSDIPSAIDDSIAKPRGIAGTFVAFTLYWTLILLPLLVL
jgi:hypothetical protein